MTQQRIVQNFSMYIKIGKVIGQYLFGLYSVKQSGNTKHLSDCREETYFCKIYIMEFHSL